MNKKEQIQYILEKIIQKKENWKAMLYIINNEKTPKAFVDMLYKTLQRWIKETKKNINIRQQKKQNEKIQNIKKLEEKDKKNDSDLDLLLEKIWI